MNTPLCSKEDYERGGWKDGRLGQVYDLLEAVLRDRGEQAFRHVRNPLLRQIEEMDE